MPRKILLCKGLPGSGKTTWARNWLAGHPMTLRVNKDELRAMLFNGVFGKGRETLVCKVRDFVVSQALSDGYEVIVDDTNFNPVHQARLEEIGFQHGTTVEIKDFSEVPLETCIERDAHREKPVGTQVIRQMHAQYLATKPAQPAYDPLLPDVILCDLDGTLALFGDANPYDRDFTKDEVNKAVYAVLHRYAADKTIILLSGRKEQCRAQTLSWLRIHGIPFDALFMRKDDDNRKDVLVKEDIYREHIQGKYNVLMVIDDRLQVCRLWHRLGLPLFRVGDPDADF